MNGCRDVAVNELKAVVAIYGMRLIRKAKAVQGAIKPISGAVAGEDATGAIASVSCGCESNDEQPGVEACPDSVRAVPSIPDPESGEPFPARPSRGRQSDEGRGGTFRSRAATGSYLSPRARRILKKI